MVASSNLWAGLERFSQPLKETEHLCRGSQEKVAKIVHCGEPPYFQSSFLLLVFFFSNLRLRAERKRRGEGIKTLCLPSGVVHKICMKSLTMEC